MEERQEENRHLVVLPSVGAGGKTWIQKEGMERQVLK
jgi:hypothetical protein